MSFTKSTCSFRHLYSINGSDDFYTNIKYNYKNPHEYIIHDIISNFKFKYDTTFLDLGCGGGEVTRALQSRGYKYIDGLDPYTFDLYYKNTGIKALQYSFQDIAYSKLVELDNYNVVIASFSLHLCPEHLLNLVCLNLALKSKWLIILSPHKNPVLNEHYWTLIKKYIVKRVHVRIYKSTLQ